MISRMFCSDIILNFELSFLSPGNIIFISSERVASVALLYDQAIPRSPLKKSQKARYPIANFNKRIIVSYCLITEFQENSFEKVINHLPFCC